MQNIKEYYRQVDKVYLPLDRNYIKRTRNIRLIPGEDNRRGGKHSYAEWAHVIGIFQTLMFMHLNNRRENMILDVGCGTGLLGIASEPFLGKNGRYIGIDVRKDDIEFCRSHYPPPGFSYIYLDASNPAYTPDQSEGRIGWDVDSDHFDLVTALSVWTHFNENDALFYFKEVNRVLKPGGKALITCFLLDETYEGSLAVRSSAPGRYHMTPQDRWVFDQSAYGSDDWFCPKWAGVPEKAIGVTNKGIKRMLSNTDLQKTDHYVGNWKEVPGVFFQDVMIFQKT